MKVGPVVTAVVTLGAAVAAIPHSEASVSQSEAVISQSETTAVPAEQVAAAPCFFFAAGTSWNCYLVLRADLAQARLNEKLPAPAVSGQTLLVNFNLTGKQEFSASKRFALDLDLFARRSWDFQQRNVFTGKTEFSSTGSAENPSYRLGLNEVFFSSEWSPEFQFALGKKRVLWGSGFASNPTDALNPGKNVLDPTLERRGAWLLLFEILREKNAASFFFAPGVVEDKNTLPEKMFRYSVEPGKAAVSRSLVGARWYQLLGSADVNLMLFRSDRYRDENDGAWKYGASWSQILTRLSKQLEGHGEVLVQRGSSRADPLMRSRIDDDSWHMSLLIGGRYDFENESSLVIELLRQTDGDSSADLKARVEQRVLRMRLAASMAAQRVGAEQGVVVASYPARESQTVASQAEATRTIPQLGMQNYLLINWQRYKINDDLFLSWSAVHNLHDAGGFQGPSLQWTPRQWASLTLSANSDYSLWPESGVMVESFGRLQEIQLNPVRARFGLELKAFF